MASPVRWADVFHRSSISPEVFVVGPDHEAQVWDLVESLGVPQVTWVSMFSPAYWSFPLLDGVVIQNSNYGFPAMMLPNAVRVVGYRPMRLLCELLGVEPPTRRLKGEGKLASPDELRRELDAQKRLPREHSSRRPRRVSKPVIARITQACRGSLL